MSERDSQEVKSKETSVRDHSSQEKDPVMTEVNLARSQNIQAELKSAESSKPDHLPNITISDQRQDSPPSKEAEIESGREKPGYGSNRDSEIGKPGYGDREIGTPGYGDREIDKPGPGAIDTRPEKIQELERHYAELIAKTGRIPEELKLILANPKTSPDGVSIDKINQLLKEMNSNFRLEDRPAPTPGGASDREVSLIAGDGNKVDAVSCPRDDENSDRPPTLEERAVLAKAIAEDIIAHGAVPQKILDAMSGKGSKNGTPINVDEINLMLAASGSKLRLEKGLSKEGHATIAVTNNGKIQDKWIIIHSDEFGDIPVNVVKPVIQPLPKDQDSPRKLFDEELRRIIQDPNNQDIWDKYFKKEQPHYLHDD